MARNVIKRSRSQSFTAYGNGTKLKLRGDYLASFPDRSRLQSLLYAKTEGVASFPGSHAREREIEVVQAIYIRVPGEPGNEATEGEDLEERFTCMTSGRLEGPGT